MQQKLMPAFRAFPAEGEAVRNIITGYTDLEIGLFNCVQIARDDFDGTLKAMFRVRGETTRIYIAEGLGLPPYSALGLAAEFNVAIVSMRYCVSIRNQFSHAAWYDDNSGKLAFANLEAAAQDNSYARDLIGLPTFRVDLALLSRIENFYVYTSEFIDWLNFEGRLKAGALRNNPIPKPKNVATPPKPSKNKRGP